MSFLNKHATVAALGLRVYTAMSGTALADGYRIAATWVCNSSGKVRIIQPVTPGNTMLVIEQRGSHLVFLDEQGRRAEGGFHGYDGLKVRGGRYGNHGRLGVNVDGMFYSRGDAERAFNWTPERSKDLNFIMWEDGTLCVRPNSR